MSKHDLLLVPRDQLECLRDNVGVCRAVEQDDTCLRMMEGMTDDECVEHESDMCTECFVRMKLDEIMQTALRTQDISVVAVMRERDQYRNIVDALYSRISLVYMCAGPCIRVAKGESNTSCLDELAATEVTEYTHPDKLPSGEAICNNCRLRQLADIVCTLIRTEKQRVWQQELKHRRTHRDDPCTGRCCVTGSEHNDGDAASGHADSP
jgi:hypothetical protein